jgi:putative transposase
VQLLRRRHQHVQRQRRDFHHKTARALLRRYDVIYLEDVQVRNMVRNHHLAKSISAAGWAAFRTILEAKAACSMRRVSGARSSRTLRQPGLQWGVRGVRGVRGVLDGSRCLQRVAKSLSVRTHICPFCGLVMDRDENAAQNMLRAGQARQAPTWVDTPSVA